MLWWQWVVSWFLGSSQVAVAVPTALAAVRELRSAGPHPTPQPGATDAYLRFQTSATQVLGQLYLLDALGMPPSIKGAVWTWPLALRAFRAVVDEAGAVATVFGEVRVLGSDDVADAAYRLAELVFAAAASFPEGSRRERATRRPAFGAAMTEAQAALGDYSTAVRAELDRLAAAEPA